jgi:hypothetical protein
MVDGLALSQLLTLYTTPVVYLYLDRVQTWCVARNAASFRRAKRSDLLPQNDGAFAPAFDTAGEELSSAARSPMARAQKCRCDKDLPVRHRGIVDRVQRR